MNQWKLKGNLIIESNLLNKGIEMNAKQLSTDIGINVGW